MQYERYLPYTRIGISDALKVDSNLTKSLIEDVSLEDFVVAREMFCQRTHKQYLCDNCITLIEMAKDIQKRGVVPVSVIYRQHSKVTYKPSKAVRLLMQLPVAVFRFSGQLFVTELVQGDDISKFVAQIGHHLTSEGVSSSLDKDTLKSICELASSEKDRTLIKVAASYRMSGSAAKEQLDISNACQLKKKVHDAIEEIEAIKNAVHEIVVSSYVHQNQYFQRKILAVKQILLTQTLMIQTVQKLIDLIFQKTL